MAVTIELDADCVIQTGRIPAALIPDDASFESLWGLHPEEFSELKIHGKTVKMPRWDRAYAKDYPFANQVAGAHTTPELLVPFLNWAQSEILPEINGLFVNWHDGKLSHYHGKHRDSTKGLIPDTPIITVSLGEERVFRMRPYKTEGNMRDFVLRSGDYVVIPWETNQRWTHEVPKFARYKGRRISVTMRAFE